MHALFDALAAAVALACEAAAVLVLAFGAAQILIVLLLNLRHVNDIVVRQRAWLGFASWILIALELTLAADIVRTALAPSWTQIGQLGAIAVIRTLLNLFLARDVESSIGRPDPANGSTPPRPTG
jgi:uncharacterized membrane protein